MSNTTPEFAAVILAAGASTRMKQCKPLLTIEKQNMLSRLVTTYRVARVFRVFVVTGAYREHVERECSRLACSVVYNEDYEKGMYSSVLKGIRSLPSDITAFFLHPSDIPLVRPSTIRFLCEHWKDSLSVLSPVLKGEKGHPPLISAKLVPSILAWSGYRGLAGLLQQYADSFMQINIPDHFIHLDIDTPDDYRKAQRAWSARNIPTLEECEELFRLAQTPQKIIEHCRVVEQMARHIALSISSFQPCRFLLAERAALLHDICRESPKHDIVGSAFLANFGFDEVAEIVKHHMDLPEEASLEAKIVYLADKIVKDFNVVSLQDRIEKKKKKFKGGKAERQGLARLRKALDIQREFENLTEGGLELGEGSSNERDLRHKWEKKRT